MRKKTRNVLRYLLEKYPFKNDLSKTRTTKLIYLIDWQMAKMYGVQLTDIQWYFDHYGPYVSDVLDEADADPKLSINETISAFGTKKYLVSKKNESAPLIIKSLSKKEKEVIDSVIEATKNMTWNEFINYVYETYPIKNTDKYRMLNLVELANESKNN